MLVKNILVLKNYTIKDHTKWYNDRSNESDLAENYTAMEQICTQSAQKYVKDLNEIKVFRGEADNIRDVFKKNFYEIYHLWQQGHNILYCDLDVVFTNDAEYFDQTKYFSMFNYTDPVSTTDDFYDVKFDHYFNCGIRYYPSDMDQAVWDLGIGMVENWNPDRWDAEQIIYNAMMWYQTTDIEAFYDPTKAYQMLFDPSAPNGTQMNDQFNGVELNEASAIHVHGSRGSANRSKLMQAMLDGNPVPDTEEYIYL